MIRLIFILIFMSVSFTAWPYGGVGGLDGGSKIFFQRESVFIEPKSNSSLCLNSQDTYQARVKLCSEFNSKNNCVGGLVPQTIYQPRVSMREVCNNRKAEQDFGSCPDGDRELKPFVQEPERIIRKLDRDGYVIEEKTIIIPNCQ